MADAIYTVVLDLTDDGCIETGWRLKQGDSGLSKIVAKVVNNGVDAFDPSVTPEIAFKRADGNSVLSTMVANNGYYEYTFVGNEISVAGRVVMDVTFTDSESRISTCSARFEVVENPAGYDPEGAHTYDNPVSVLVEEAKKDASDAEAWSSGTRNGEPVSSGDPTYHNNSKYWSEQANPTLLQNLQDVVLNSPTEGQALIYDATNEVWKNGNGGGSGSSTLSGLTDVNLESPVNGETLIYDSLNQEWINGQAGATNLNGLTDVVLTTPSNNQVLKYDSVNHVWKNANESGGGGGLLPHLYIDSEAGSTVTVVAPDSSVITPTQISSGHWECDVPDYGVYTIHAVLNGDDAVITLTVDDVKEYHITDNHFSYTLSVYAPTGSTIRVTDGVDETYTGTGAGSTAVTFGLHQASTTYTVQVTLDGVSKSDSVTTPSTSGGTGSKTFEFGTINVTLDADFIGETITCVNGGTTISKTASTTSLVFYPPTTGTWAISGEVGGTTCSVNAEVTSLSTPVSVSLQVSITVTVTMYGAAGAVISYTDANGSQTQTLDSSGKKENVSITVEPNSATIVFTDTTVAKNPSNLSNNYTKSVTITSGMTEIYVMPDNAVYWWGYEKVVASAVSYRPSDFGGNSAAAPTITRNTTSMSIAEPSTSQGSTIWNNIDLSNASAVKALCSIASSAGFNGANLNVAEASTITADKYEYSGRAILTTTEQVLSIDVTSINDSRAIGLGIGFTTVTLKFLIAE